MHRSVRDSLSRVGRWPRLLAAGACLLLAAVSALGATHGSPEHAGLAVRTVAVVVARRDLPAGSVLTTRDLGVSRWPRDLAPPGSVARPGARVGARLAGPLRTGEAITATRLVGSSLTDGLAAGLAAVPVAVTQPQALDLVHAGSFVELVAAPQEDLGLDPSAGTSGSSPASADSTPAATVLARRLLVLAVLPVGGGDLTSDESASIVVAADSATTLDIARAQSVGVVLAVTVSP